MRLLCCVLCGVLRCALSAALAAHRLLPFSAPSTASAEGGIYAAEDADSLDPASGQKKEGWFYAWSHDEIAALLGELERASERGGRQALLHAHPPLPPNDQAANQQPPLCPSHPRILSPPSTQAPTPPPPSAPTTM